jgi:hypothetical protein
MKNKLKLWWLKVNCPRFYEDMPKINKTGTWEIGSTVGSLWHSMEYDNETFTGDVKDAYIRARQLAMERDWKVPLDDDLGVNWFVRLIK